MVDVLVLVWLGDDRAWPPTTQPSEDSAAEREMEEMMEISGCETIVELGIQG